MALKFPHIGGGGKERGASAEDIARADRVVVNASIDPDEQLVNYLVTVGKLKTEDDLMGELNMVRKDMDVTGRQALVKRVIGIRVAKEEQANGSGQSLA